VLKFEKLIQENEKSCSQVKELRKRSSELEVELHKSNQLNKKLSETRGELRLELESMKQTYSRNVGDQSAKLGMNEEKISDLELEVTKYKSKLDESYLQLNEMKKNFQNQLKQVGLILFYNLVSKTAF
jgi:chromosome segregation ATPase